MFQCSSQEISLKVTLMYCCTCIGSNPVKSTIGVSSGVSFLVGGGRSSILQNTGNTAECDVWAQGCIILKLDMHSFTGFTNRMNSDEWALGRIFPEEKSPCWEQDIFSSFSTLPTLLLLHSCSYCFIPASCVTGNIQNPLTVISVSRAQDGAGWWAADTSEEQSVKDYGHWLLAVLTLLFWKTAEDWIHFALVSKATSHPEIRPVTCLDLN